MTRQQLPLGRMLLAVLIMVVLIWRAARLTALWRRVVVNKVVDNNLGGSCGDVMICQPLRGLTRLKSCFRGPHHLYCRQPLKGKQGSIPHDARNADGHDARTEKFFTGNLPRFEVAADYRKPPPEDFQERLMRIAWQEELMVMLPLRRVLRLRSQPQL